MSNLNVHADRFGQWLLKNKLAEHVNTVVNLIESEYLFANGDDPDAIRTRAPGSIRRSFNKVISRAKLEEAVADYVRNDFKLRTLVDADVKDIIVRSVKSKYQYAVRFEKSMHKQGIYVDKVRMPRKTVKAVEQSAVA